MPSTGRSDCCVRFHGVVRTDLACGGVRIVRLPVKTRSTSVMVDDGGDFGFVTLSKASPVSAIATSG